MSNSENQQSDQKVFYDKLEKQHESVSPCFMTGKGCVYAEIIDEQRKRQCTQERDPRTYSGFMITPFQPNLRAFFEICLKRRLEQKYSIELLRADHVRQIGYVVCEKICKKIQESDFVIADLSVPNKNVFYELGLAYGINQKIIVIYHHESEFGKDICSKLTGCKPYVYRDLSEDFQLSQYILSCFRQKRHSNFY
jgi:predicted nucleotide-binding protein